MRVENFGTLKYYQSDDILNYYSKFEKEIIHYKDYVTRKTLSYY